jgi:hypothetical protein
MNITSSQYLTDPDGNNQCISAIIDGHQYIVPLDPANRHYAEIKAKHDNPDDSFTIQDAD